MRFIDTKRFAPVATGMDLPHKYDLFHHNPILIPKNKEKRKEYIKKNNIVTDKEWWRKQKYRCMNGYTVPNAITKGGTAYVDGVDCFWYGDDCTVPIYDITFKNKSVHISGRMYFYLNFWIIYGKLEGTELKGLMRPKFLDMDYFYYRRIEMMFEQRKDSQDLKGRQGGFSEKEASNLSYNFTFVPGSVSIIVAGEQADADHTMENCQRGLDNLINTQFYQHRAIGGNSSALYIAESKLSEIRALTAKDKPQSVSRFCLAKGTKVIMYDGVFRNVEDVKVGDQLMGTDSNPRNISLLSSGIDDMYKISSSKTESFICNSDHLLYCYHKPVIRKNNISKYGKYVTNNFNDPDIIKIDDLHFIIKAKDFYKKSKTFQRHTLIEKSRGIEFKDKNVLIDPYLLGLWLGDGDSDGIRITTMDQDIIDYLNCFVQENKLNITRHEQINPLNKKLNKSSRYRIWETRKNRKGGIRKKSDLMESFRKYELINNKHIPNDYKYNSRKVRLELLAGLLDTDGWKNKNGYGFAQVNRNIAYDVKYICESLGFNVCMKLKKNGVVNGYKSNDIYDFYIYGEKIGEIPLRIKRKKQPNYEYRSLHPHKAVMHIESIGQGEYYGFELDGNHLFLLSDFTITHNTPFWVLHEEIGKGKAGWSLAVSKFIAPSQYAEGVKTGYQRYIGTGGDMEAGAQDLEERHYKPNQHNILSFPEVFSEVRQPELRVGHFTPKWMFIKIDKDGNSLKEESIKWIEAEIEKETDPKQKYISITQYPIYDHNVFMIESGGFFGKEAALMLNKRKNWMRSHPNEDIIKIGILKWKNPDRKNEGVYWVDDANGWCKIAEHPIMDPNNKNLVYANLYEGACLLPGQKVITNNGIKNVEDVSSKDKLVNENGDYVKIEKFLTREKIDSDVYTIKVSNTFRTNTVTEDHPTLISKPKFKPDLTIDENSFDFDYINAKDINIGDWTRIPNIYTGSNDFDINILWNDLSQRIDRQIKSPLLLDDFWWFVGLWLGDGYCDSKGKKISISINSDEVCYIERLNNLVTKIFNRKLNIRKQESNSVTCTFSLQQLNTFLTKYFGRYSYGKYISEWIKFIDPKLKRQLLLGYLDSDGCISIHTRGYYYTVFVSINLELLESIQDIGFSLGLISNLCKLRNESTHKFQNGKLYNTKECYQLRFGHHDTLNLVTQLNWSGDIKIQRIDFANLPKLRRRSKEDCFISIDGKYIYFKIKDIQKSKYTGMVYNFECDTHTYIGHHIGWHNCDSYDQDEAHTSDSKGCCVIRKGYVPEHSIYNTYVAFILERPTLEQGGAEIFYEHTAMLTMYYGCQNNIEYSNLRIFDYYTITNHFDYLLKSRPRLAFAGKIKESRVSNPYGTDKSLKPHALAILANRMNEDFISRLLFKEIIEAWIKFRYDPSGKKYNCDITVATAYAEVSAKEVEFQVVMKKEDLGKNKPKDLVYRKVGGQLVPSFV